MSLINQIQFVEKFKELFLLHGANRAALFIATNVKIEETEWNSPEWTNLLKFLNEKNHTETQAFMAILKAWGAEFGDV